MTNAAVHLEGQQHSLQTHVHDALASGVTHTKGQQHPIKLYLVVWGWLFVLSTCSYLVDYFGLHGYLRWSLILLFMGVEGWSDRCRFHAHGLGAAGLGLRDPAARRYWCWCLSRSWCSSPTTRISLGSYFSRQRRSHHCLVREGERP